MMGNLKSHITILKSFRGQFTNNWTALAVTAAKSCTSVFHVLTNLASVIDPQKNLFMVGSTFLAELIRINCYFKPTLLYLLGIIVEQFSLFVLLVGSQYIHMQTPSMENTKLGQQNIIFGNQESWY